MSREQDLLKAVLEARELTEDLEMKLSRAKQVQNDAEAKLIEQMDNSDLKSFKSETFNCNVIKSEKLYVSIDKDKKEEAMIWIEEDCGRKDMIKPSIHSSTLTSFISQRLKKGDSVPQDMFKYFFKPLLTIRAGK